MARFPPVPVEERRALEQLSQLSEVQFAQFKERLRVAPLLIDRDQFLKGVGSVEGVDEADLKSALLGVLFLSNFLGLPADISLDAFVKDVCGSLRESGLPAERVDWLQTHLPEVLSLDAVSTRAKALELQVDHSRAFQAARVLTDVRPVFSSEAAMQISGLLVVHTLKIEYFEEQQNKEIFIALDERDLATLKQVISRAEQKADVIKNQFIDALGVGDFGTTTGGRKDSK